MPGDGKTRRNYDEQIAALNKKIARHKSNIATLKAKRQKLMDKRERKNMDGRESA